MKPNGKLSVMTKMKYGVGDFGMAVVTAMLQFSMLFYYTDIVGVNPALAGTAILIGKITWDLVNDTLFGYLEDKTKSRWGKRRPYLIFGALPFALSFWGVFSIPQGIENDLVCCLLIVGSFILFDTFHTLTATAYSAMTAEITEDYNERTSLSTYRMVFSVIGYISGAGLSGTLAGIFSNAFGITIHQGWSLVGLVFGVLGGLSMLIPGLFLKYEPAVESKPSELPPFKSILSTFKNKPFVSYIIVTSIMSISFTMVTAMLNYYINHQLHMEESGLLVMLAMMGTLAVFLVPCGILSGKIGKAKTYAVGLTIASVALIFVFFMPVGPSPLIFVLAAIAGLGFSAQWVCPHSMIPDVIEYDELMTGERREGVYYGVHATSGKITGALASAACGWGLEIGRYVENSASQPDSALLAIRILFALIPAIFLLICVPLLIKYPITKESHSEVMRQLAERRAQTTSTEENAQ